MDTYCLICGARYRLGTDHVCSKPERPAKKSTASRKDGRSSPNQRVQSTSGVEDHFPVEAVVAEGSGRARFESEGQAGTQAPPVDTKPKRGRPPLDEPKSARAAYQREYMRKRRAKLKEGK